jgi:hypothetical protein
VNCSGEDNVMTAIRKQADCVSGGIEIKAIGNLAMTCGENSVMNRKIGFV